MLDPNGATTINAVHGTIVDDSNSALVTGQSLTLKAAGAIGTTLAPIQVVVTGHDGWPEREHGHFYDVSISAGRR